MSGYDDFKAILDELEPPNGRQGPSMRALENRRAQLMSEGEREASDAYESQPTQRQEHRRAIERQPDPARRQILREAYDADTLRFDEREAAIAGPRRGAPVGEKSDAELGAEFLQQFGAKAAPADDGVLDSVKSAVDRGIDWVSNLLRPSGPEDRRRQQQRIDAAQDGLNQTQRDVIARQRAGALGSAAEPGLRVESSRMRIANIEADREGRPRPYPEAQIANLERQQLPANALSEVERRVQGEAQRARDVAMSDFWRNVEASVKGIDPLYRKMLGGVMMGMAEAPIYRAETPEQGAEGPLTPDLTDQEREQMATLGRTLVKMGEEREKELTKDLRPGLGAQSVGMAIQSLAIMGPALGAGLITRSPLAVIGLMSAETGAIAYGEGREEGLSPGQAGVYAMLHAVIEGGTEYAPVKQLFAGAGKGTLQWFLNFLSKEVGQELLATGLQNAVDKVSVRPEMTWDEYAEELLLTITSTPLAAGAQAGAVRALRGREADAAEQQAAILQKFREGVEQFKQVTEAAAKAAVAQREARGPATHRLEDGTPVRARAEQGKPVRGVWETDEGDLVEADRAEPVKKPEANAEWTVNGVGYEVQITGPGQEIGTARLADGQEVPLTEFASLGEDAKALLGMTRKTVGRKPAPERRPAAAAVEPSPPPGSRSAAVAPPSDVSPEAVRPPQAVTPTPSEPGAELPNGFRAGPEKGSKYRVSRVKSAGGAVMLEKRSPSGIVSSFYVGKDGKLVDADTVELNDGRALGRLWKAIDDEAAAEVKAVLDQMGRLAVNDPDRAPLRQQLIDLVKKPKKPPTEEALRKMREARARRAQVNTDTDSIVSAVIKLGGIGPIERLDITGDTKGSNPKIPFLGALFNAEGESLDGMAEKLYEMGYLNEEERGDLTVIAERIRDEIGPNNTVVPKHWSMQRSDRALAADERAKAELSEDPDRELADEAEALAGDIPLQFDIPPEELAERGLTADASKMVITDLMSQLDEDTRERFSIQYAEAPDEELIVALRRELEKPYDTERDEEGDGDRQTRQRPPPRYKVTKIVDSEAAEGEAAQVAAFTLPDGTELKGRAIGPHFDAVAEHAASDMPKLIAAFDKNAKLNDDGALWTYPPGGTRVRVQKAEFMTWLFSDQAIKTAPKELVETARDAAEHARDVPVDQAAVEARKNRLKAFGPREIDEGAPVAKTPEDVNWNEYLDYFAADINGRRAIILKPVPDMRPWHVVVSGSMGQLRNKGVAQSFDEAKAIAFDGHTKDPEVKTERGGRGTRLVAEQARAAYGNEDGAQWVARIKKRYGDGWLLVAERVIEQVERNIAERPIPGENAIRGTYDWVLASRRELVAQMRRAVFDERSKVKQPKGKYVAGKSKAQVQADDRAKAEAHWRQQEKDYRETFSVGDTVQIHAVIADTVDGASAYVSGTFGKIEKITPTRFHIRTFLYGRSGPESEPLLDARAMDFGEVTHASYAHDDSFTYEKWRDDMQALMAERAPQPDLLGELSQSEIAEREADERSWGEAELPEDEGRALTKPTEFAVGDRVENEKGDKGEIIKAEKVGGEQSVEVKWERTKSVSLIRNANRNPKGIPAPGKLQPWERLRTIAKEKPPERGGDLFSKPTEAPQPKLTGPEPPLLTTPEGTAPPKSVDEQKVPTQQLKLFQRTVDYAAKQAETPESQAQAEAGNYSKGHWIVGPKGHQLDISIETPEGEKRRPEWPPLKDHYGYIKGTIGFDKDHLDVFVKPGTRDDFGGLVFVVNQVVGGFDEHKVMLGYGDLADAREGYLRNYAANWDGLDSIIPMSFKAFTQWAQTKGGKGPKGGPLSTSLAKKFEAMVSLGGEVPASQRKDRDEGAATPQLDLFSQTPVPGTPGVLFEKIVVESERTGSVRLPSTVIRDHVDAASAFTQLVKSPRERFHMLGLNERDEPIAYYDLFAGTLTQTSVYPREVWLALYQTPEVRKVWLAHNHPSGLASPSNADELLNDSLSAGLTRDLGIEFKGHIIIAGQNFHAMGLGTQPLPQVVAQGKEIPVRERVVKLEQDRGVALQSPGAMREYLGRIKPERSGLLLMDAQHRPIAFYYMAKEEMSKLRTHELTSGFAKLMRQVGRNNPAAAVAYFPGEAYSPEIQRAVSNVGGALAGADVRMLDAFTPVDVGSAQGLPSLASFAERGRSTALQPFYSLSGRWSDMTVPKVQEELMSNPIAQAFRSRIEYVDNPYQLPQHMIDELMAIGGIAKVSGAWSPVQGKVYLVASNLQPGEASTTILHEFVGHYGMDQILGEKYVDFMLDVYRSRAGDIQAEARTGPLRNYNFDFRKPEHQIHAASEWLAHRAERGEEANLWQRFVAMVRLWLRENGFVKEWSESDILMMLRQSRLAVINGGNTTYNGSPAWQLAAPRPIWRSTLMDRVRELGPKRATTAEWRKFVGGLLQKGVKPDEIEWTGLREWFDALDADKETTILPKDNVLEFLTDHGVQIEERILGEPNYITPAGITDENEMRNLLRERDNLQVALDAHGFDVEYDEEGKLWGVIDRNNDAFYLADPNRVPRREDEPGRHLLGEEPYAALPDSNVSVEGVGGTLRQAVDRLREIAPTTAWHGDDNFVGLSVTRYEKWALPGGRNYRELLLTLPPPAAPSVVPPYARADAFTPPHFDTLNLFAHVRFDERTDAEGKRVLFVEEFQSDWAEQGRKRGFRGQLPSGHHVEQRGDGMFVVVREGDGARIGGSRPTRAEAVAHFDATAIPRAPFVGKTEQWTALLLKRVIRYAAENGFERVAWTTGDQQNDRYGIGTRVSEVSYEPPGDGQSKYRITGKDTRGRRVDLGYYTAALLPDVVGEDLAKRIIAGEGEADALITEARYRNATQSHFQVTRHGVYLGDAPTKAEAERLAPSMTRARTLRQELRIGGKAMIEFYDKIVPIVANNVLKKVGGGRVVEVGIAEIRTAQGNYIRPSTARASHFDVFYADGTSYGSYRTRELAGDALAKLETLSPSPRPTSVVVMTQLGFDITPAMRDAALRGLPMFSLRDDVSRMADQMRALGRRVDQAYRRGQKNAEDLDAELAQLRVRYSSTLEQLEGELEVEQDAEDAADYSTVEEQFRDSYWRFMGDVPSGMKIETRTELADRLRHIVSGTPSGRAGSDEQLIEAARDAYAAHLARAARRTRFSLREPVGVREVYGVKDGRLLGMAVKRGNAGIWDVYLANGTNENMFARGQFRRDQAASLNEVNRMFNREGLELNVIKPRNLPVPDSSLFDRDWVAPKADSYLRRAVIYFQNRLLLPELYERTIAAQVGAIPESAKAHREARIAHPRAAGKIADFDHDHSEPIIDLMKANRFTLRDVGDYLYARHAPERNAAIESINPDNKAGSGITTERAAQMMQGLRDRLGARFAAMEQIGALANRISRFREDVMIDKGLAKMEAVALLQQKYPNYVPLKEMATDEHVQTEVGGGYQVGRLINTAFGRFTEAQSEFILPALIAQAKGTISAGENAAVLRSLLRQVEFAPNPGVWRIQKHVWKPYIDQDTGQVQYAPRSVLIDAKYGGRAISVPVNGERVIIMMADERMAQAYKTSGQPVSEFTQMIGTITRFYALMATAANPEFVVTNLMRDFQQAVIRISGEQNPGLALKVAKDVPGALWGAFAGLHAKGQLKPDSGDWHRWYRRYIEAGGHVAYRGLQDVETQHKDFLTTLADSGIMPEAVAGLTKTRLRAHRVAKVAGVKFFANLIINANGAVENALRLSTFKNAVESGWNEKDAAFLARNVTVDFNLKGNAGTLIGAYYMFFNANIQGSALLFRSVANHRAIQALALMLFLLGMGFDWWNRRESATEPDGRKVYDNINDAIKERNFILMTPDGEDAITVPLPFGFNVFYVAGVHAMSVMQGAKTPLDAAGDMLVTMINAFNPFGQSPESALGALQLISPTFFDPFAQAMTNRNWFDRSIVPERPRTAPPQAKSATYYAGTPQGYVDVTAWLNEATGGNEVRSGILDIAPNMLEHWTRSIFGGAGAFYARTAEFVHGKAVGAEPEVRDIPFLRRFYYQPKDFELSHRFYENLNAAETAHFEVQRAFERGQQDKARAYASEFRGERSMYAEAQAVERQIGVLRKEVWRVRKNDRLTDDQRTKQIEQLQGRIRQAMMGFNKRFEERAAP
ncbi:MAG: hypothetical protein OEW90_01745 [Betaproteobacteria bacterium]|nr:hypothetical protein [Betaproteobacteria bacterium]MDH4322842.1 hypothetical protein [Betaproteobacteria bacterium]